MPGERQVGAKSDRPAHIDAIRRCAAFGLLRRKDRPAAALRTLVALDGSGGQSRATVLRHAIAGKGNAREAEQRITQVDASGTALPIAKSMRRSSRDELPRKKDGAYPFAPLPFTSTRLPIEGAVGRIAGSRKKGSRLGGGKKPNPRDGPPRSFTRTGTLAMTRNIFTNVACFLLLSIAPAAAQVSSALKHKVPAPEVDAGLLALVMVGGVAFLTYWRKRRS